MVWTCDYKGCDEFAQWCRVYKGELLTLCTKHHALVGRKKWGKHLDVSKLSEDDIRYLVRKERRKEFERRHPFDVRLFGLENGWKIKVRDLQTDEKRSFVIKKSDLGRFNENFTELERKGFSPKPSIDDYVKKLRKEEEQ